MRFFLKKKYINDVHFYFELFELIIQILSHQISNILHQKFLEGSENLKRNL